MLFSAYEREEVSEKKRGELKAGTNYRAPLSGRGARDPDYFFKLFFSSVITLLAEFTN